MGLAQGRGELRHQCSKRSHLGLELLRLLADLNKLFPVPIDVLLQICGRPVLQLAKVTLVFSDLILGRVRQQVGNIYGPLATVRILRIRLLHLSTGKFGSLKALRSTFSGCDELVCGASRPLGASRSSYC